MLVVVVYAAVASVLALSYATEPGEVDAVIEEARRAGATLVREPAETFWGGYSAAFTDPDGHAWELAYNPGFPLAEDGTVTLPDFG